MPILPSCHIKIQTNHIGFAYYFLGSHSFLAGRYDFMTANRKQKQEEIGGTVSSKTVLTSLKHFDILEMVCFQVLIVEVQEIKG